MAAAEEHHPAALPLLSAWLPVDSRARACCVCRAWRAALAEPALWTRLDLPEESGVARGLNPDAMLNGAARRARGQLHSLDISSGPRSYSTAMLLEVLAAARRALRAAACCLS
jgi:hypothetical protein